MQGDRFFVKITKWDKNMYFLSDFLNACLEKYQEKFRSKK